MNAVADYNAAKALLRRPLPAYVSYTARSHAKFDAILHDDTSQVVVRTKDMTVVKGGSSGRPPYVQIGGQEGGGGEAITDPAFVPRCYAATGARLDSYEGSKVEAIALREQCGKSKGDKDFDTLYVDPATRRTIAAVGTVKIRTSPCTSCNTSRRSITNMLPSALYVRVQGSGLMGWLDVLYDCRYENYRFSQTQP